MKAIAVAISDVLRLNKTAVRNDDSRNNPETAEKSTLIRPLANTPARNNRNNSIELAVSDQIPISQNKQIEVEAEELSGGKLSEIDGKVKWTLKLSPGESKQLVLTYRVKYPKNQKVILE